MTFGYDTHLDDIIYLNHAAIGVLTTEVADLLLTEEKKAAYKGEFKLDLEGFIQQWDAIRSNFAKLINGDSSGVAITHNTAKGLHIVGDGLQHLYNEGKNIVITELEFTTNSYVWQKICHRHNMELRVVKFDDVFDDFSNYIDTNTVLVSISFVQFSNGFRVDLKKLAAITHENGAFLVVDAIQGLGVVPFDVQELGVDFVATGGYKWLCGPMGHGYFYANKRIRDEFDSILVGWFGDEQWMKQSHHPYTPWPDVREYQDFLSPRFKAINRSLEIILDLDPSVVFTHVKKLQDQLIESIENSTYQLSTNMMDRHRSGIIKFDHPNAENIVKTLKDKNISVSFREGGIRLSPHWHNTSTQIERVANELLNLSNN